MRKPRSYAEVYNDLEGEVVNLFRALQDKTKAIQLERLLKLTPFARGEFDLAYETTSDQIENARRLIIRAFMGFGADANNKENGKTGFRANSNRSGTTPAHDWASYPKQIEYFCERLQGVVIENRYALEVMDQHDLEETLHFLDPPYVHETRSKNHLYRHEMNDADHLKLIDQIKSLKGMVVLCGYENDLYEKLNWKTVKRKAFADGARERTEVMWLNDRAIIAQSQLRLNI
jgi:DNA adenine methylase